MKNENEIVKESKIFSEDEKTYLSIVTDEEGLEFYRDPERPNDFYYACDEQDEFLNQASSEVAKIFQMMISDDQLLNTIQEFILAGCDVHLADELR